MPNHWLRNTVLVLLTVVLSVFTIYSLTLYNQSLNSISSSHSRTFWQLLTTDLAHKQAAMSGWFKK